MRLSGKALDYLAGATVLGTASWRVRARMAALAERDPQVAAALAWWNTQLGGLAGWVPPIRPQPSTWTAIETRLAARSGEAGWLATRRWRVAAAAVLLALSLAGGWLLWQPAPMLSAQITDAQGQLLWRFTASGDGRQLTVTAGRRGLVPAGRSLELWALLDGGRPAVSLGVLPEATASVLQMREGQRQALLSAQQLAISVEPPGGSPTGQHTGPVIHVARLLHPG